MSYTREKGFFEKLLATRSIKGFAQNFILRTRAGQKLFLFNEKLPRVINISFNEHTCMYKCVMCPYSENSVREAYKKKEEMSFETLKNLVASIPNDPYYSFDISSIGETLEFAPLSDFVAHMKQEKPLVNTIISTNGVLLNDEISVKLINSGLDNMQVSLFAQNAEDHRLITGTSTFEKVRKNIQNFWRIRNELGSTKPFVQIFMMETEETKQYSDGFIDEWSQYSDKAFLRPMYNVGRKIEGLTPLEEHALPTRYPCIAPWYSTAVCSNGDILACYAFHWHVDKKEDMVIGNINNNTLEEIYSGQNMREFRKKHLELDFSSLPVCGDCDGWAGYTDIWGRENGVYHEPKLAFSDFFIGSTIGRGG